MELDQSMYKCPKCHIFQVKHLEPIAPVYLCHNCYSVFYMVTDLLGNLTFLNATKKGRAIGFWVEMKKGNLAEKQNPFEEELKPDDIPF